MPETRSVAPSRSRSTLLLAVAVVAAATLGSVTPAAGQDDTTPPTTAPSNPPTTSSPLPTIDLGDGDIVIVPPGAGDPDDPAAPDDPDQGNLSDPTRPGESAPPGPGDPDGPDSGEIAVPEELAVVLPDPTPGLNQALANIDVSRARAAVDATDAVYRPALQAERDAYDDRRRSIDARRQASERVRRMRSVANDLAINAFMFGDFGDVGTLVDDATVDDLRDATLVDIAAAKVFGDLDAARDAHAAAVVAEEESTRVLQAIRRQVRGAEREYLAARSDLDQAMVAAEASRREVGPAILGASVLDAVDLVTWYRTYYAADPPVAPIQDIIDAYLAVGEQEGVTGDIAFAQAMLETGGFRSGHARDFNFAGIGAYDSCSPRCGFNFPSIEAGVRSHIQLLRAYATPGLTRAQLATEPDPRLSPERVGVAGCCVRWTQLTGVWATDPNYDRKVLGIYRLMVEIARDIDRAQA